MCMVLLSRYLECPHLKTLCVQSICPQHRTVGVNELNFINFPEFVIYYFINLLLRSSQPRDGVPGTFIELAHGTLNSSKIFQNVPKTMRIF